ncbi:hypothetical protein [Gottfriedia acidiceleris]|uniref:hypothetical protein n=1 Tax=Gottfriedia acidiceleris TaxID=371036 RepID=UPI002FFFE2AA
MVINMDWGIFSSAVIGLACFLAYYFFSRRIEKLNEGIIEEQDEEIKNLKRRLARWENVED